MATESAAAVPRRFSATQSGPVELTVIAEDGSGSGTSSRLQSPPNERHDSTDDAIEDYDELQPDPSALAQNSRASLDSAYRPAQGASSDETPSGKDATTNPTSNSRKRASLQVRLEQTDKKGHYIITADDPDTKAILRRSLERESGKGKPRMRIRDLVFTRQFTTFDRQNPGNAESPFFGFFTLFWICMLFVFVNSAMKNYREYGSILGPNELTKMMLSRDIWVLGVTEGVMYLATFQTYFLQLLVKWRVINWARSGWVLQNIWQAGFLGAVIGWTFFREWPWTHTIFVTLHCLVYVMKQHSFAFYNGYLSSVAQRKALLEKKLAQLEATEPTQSPPTSPVSPRTRLEVPLATGVEQSNSSQPVKRRPSINHRTSTNLHKEDSPVAAVAAAIESGRPLDADQLKIFSGIIQSEIDDLAKEIQGKSEDGSQAYPKNLSMFNFAEYICFPTLVYELSYPRQDKINWWYVAEKSAATFGTLCIMQVISQAFIYPLVMQTVAMKEAGMSLDERSREFPFIVCDMLFPMLIEQLLTWYVIWECILNVLAEVTRFADRGFYGDWWNSVTWDQYARDWNRPVHNFLLRHVYYSSISTLHVSKHMATFITFFLSALVHELCMALLFKKIRGYLFWMQLMQIPLVTISRSKFLKGRVILGNTIFWLGLFMGPSVLICLYLII